MRKIKFTLIKFSGCLLFQINQQSGFEYGSHSIVLTDLGRIRVCISSCPEIRINDYDDDDVISSIYLRGGDNSRDNSVLVIKDFNDLNIDQAHALIVNAIKTSIKSEWSDF